MGVLQPGLQTTVTNPDYSTQDGRANSPPVPVVHKFFYGRGIDSCIHSRSAESHRRETETDNFTLLKIVPFFVRVTVEGREVPPTVSSHKGKNANLHFEYSQNVYMLQAACRVPASIAFSRPNADLLGQSQTLTQL